MDKKIKNIVHILEEKYGNSCNFTSEKIAEIVINCLSLVEAWLSNEKNSKKLSYELELYDKDDFLVETLHGLSRNNIGESIADIIVGKSHLYSKVVLNSFTFSYGEKASNKIGELEIS